MKKILLAFISILAFGGLLKSQNMSSIIRDIPQELILEMSDDQKEQLAMQLTDTTKVMVQNMFGGIIERTEMTPDYVAIKTSEIGTLQIKLLPLINNTHIIGVITTVCDKACDSRIDFYTTEWKPLSQNDLFPTKDKEWFIKKNIDRDSQEFKNIYGALDMTPIQLQFSPTDDTVTSVYTIEKYLGKDDYKLLKPYIEEEPVVFKWDKTSFKN